MKALRSVEERFWEKVDRRGADECWDWVGAIKDNGYGCLTIGLRSHSTRRTLSAHRISYEIAYGPIAFGLQIDHLCRNRACVNPAHLEAVTRRVNQVRGIGFVSRNAAVTHCPQGHEFNDENTYRAPGAPGKRKCRICMRERQRVRRAA